MAWGEIETVRVSLAQGDYGMSDVPTVGLDGEQAAWVRYEVFSYLKAKIEEIEAELTALGVDFESAQMTVADLVIGASAH